MATKTASKTNVQQRKNQVLQTVKKVNCMFIDLAEDMIEGTVATGTKYQKMAVKVINKSEPIIEKQVELLFDTAEMAIEQVQSNSKRFQKLLGITKQVDQASIRIGELVKTVSEKVEDSMEDVTNSSSKAIKSIKKVVEKNIGKEVSLTSVKDAVVKTIKPQAKTVKSTATKAAKTVKATATKSAAKATKTVKATASKAAPKTVKSTPAKKTTTKARASVKRVTKAAAKKTTSAKATVKTTAKKASTTVKKAVAIK